MKGHDHITIDITPDGARSLLLALADDENVREAFLDSPRGVLADYDIHIPEEMIPPEVSLPEPEEIHAMLEDFSVGREFCTTPNAQSTLIFSWAHLVFFALNLGERDEQV